MDDVAIQRYAKLIVSISKGLSEVDPNAQTICSDIVGKTKLNDKTVATKKISDVLTRCSIKSTDEETQKIFEQIRTLI